VPFTTSRTSGIAFQRAWMWRLTGMTRFSLRVIVGERAGSIAVAGVGDPGLLIAVPVAARPRSAPAAIEAAADSLAVASTGSANAGSLVTIVPNSWPISTVSPTFV